MRFSGRVTVLFFLAAALAIPVDSCPTALGPTHASRAKKARTKQKQQNIKAMQMRAERDYRNHDIVMRRQQYQQMQQAQQQGMKQQQMQQLQHDSLDKKEK